MPASSLTSTALARPMAKAKKAKGPQVTFYNTPRHNSHENSSGSSETYRPYSQISLDAVGSLSINDTRIKIDVVPPSTTTDSSPIHEESQSNLALEENSQTIFSSFDLVVETEPIDPMYEEHVASKALPGKKRARDPGVSPSTFRLWISFKE